MSRYLKCIAFAAVVFVALPTAPVWAANTNTYATLHASEPAIPEGQGRIYFYRESGIMGAVIQPTIYIDGVSTGGYSKPGDYFYVDKVPGNYQVSTTTETKKSITVTVAAAQLVYVKTSVSMGFLVGRVTPEVVEAAVGEKEIKDCDYAPPKTAPASAPASAPAPAAPPTQSAPAPTAPSTESAPAIPANTPATAPAAGSAPATTP